MAEESKLTQSDFRKLLQTSAEISSSESGNKNRKALGGGKHVGRTNTGGTARPIPVPPAKKSQRSRPSAYKKSDEVSKYRDRAAERRQGIENPDIDEQAVAMLPLKTEYKSVLAASETQHTGMTEEQRIAYERSKYLGGDIESTHLVKGLDYLLLEKIRAETTAGDSSQQILDSELEDILEQRQQQSSEKPDISTGPDQLGSESSTRMISDEDLASAKTKLGKKVLCSLREIREFKNEVILATTNDSALVAPNQTFLPGRMYYHFGTESITSRIRSQDEISLMINSGHPVMSVTQNDTSDHIVLTKVIAAISASQSRRSEASSVIHVAGSPKLAADQSTNSADEDDISNEDKEEEEEAVVGPASLDVCDSDDDIFADAGVDYQVTVGPIDTHSSIGPTAIPSTNDNYTSSFNEDDDDVVVAPYPESECNSEIEPVTEPYPESDAEMGVTEPYPESDSEMIVTEPYPESLETNSLKRPYQEDKFVSDSDSDEGGDAMELFSQARMRFKEETSGILRSLAPSKSSDSSKRHTKKAKDSGSLDKEWHQTRKLMKAKYGIDIDTDDPLKKS